MLTARPWIAALGTIAIGLAALVLLIPAAPLTGDGASYVEFVRNGLQHGASTWHERRLLGPAIVRALPLDPLNGFFVLTVVSLSATALLTWRAASDLLGSHSRAFVAIPLLFGTWVVAPNMREYALVDPLAWVFVAAIWLCTVRRLWLHAAILGGIGVLAKEVVVLAAVAAAVAAWDRHRVWQALAVVAPAVVVVVALTLVVPGSGTDATAYVLKWVRDGLGSLGPLRAVYLVVASYGALWLLVPIGFRALPAYVRRAGLVYLLAAVALPFVGSPERMEEAIFPLVVGCAVMATRAWPALVVWVFALCSAVFVARVGGDARIPTAVAWSCLALASVIVAWRMAMPGLALRRGPRGTTAPST
ncbi:MAG TPA: hypothetical protein VGL99_26705 [Chloroflexota bacterium]|jgi:hypothetical protein